MDKASDTDLRALKDSAADVFGSILAGGDAKAAVIRVSKAASYTPAWTSRLCEVTNRLLAVERIEDPGEKAAGEYPTIQPDEVLKEMFPTDILATSKAASVTGLLGHRIQYGYRDIVKHSTEKRASVPEKDVGGLCGFQDEQEVLDVADGIMQDLKPARKMARRAEVEAEFDLAPICKMAVTAIRNSGLDPALIEERAVAFFGKDAHATMDAISDYATDFTRFKGEPRVFTTNPWDREPFSNVKEAVIRFRQTALELDMHRRIADIAGRAANQLNHGIRKAAGSKEALNMGAALAGYAASQLQGIDSSKKDVSTAGLTSEDVSYLNSIKARQALVSALKDDVVQRSDLSDIISTYNSITDVGPRQALRAPHLVSMLRQALQQPDIGGTDLALLQNVEQGIAKQEDVTKV